MSVERLKMLIKKLNFGVGHDGIHCFFYLFIYLFITVWFCGVFIK